MDKAGRIRGAQVILNRWSLALSRGWKAAMDALTETYRESVTPLCAQAIGSERVRHRSDVTISEMRFIVGKKLGK